MFKSKYWSGVYVATMGWWGLLALVRFVKMSDMRLNPTVGMMLAPSLVVLMILASGFVGYQTEAIRRKKNLLWGLHAIVGGVGAAGLVPLTSEVVRDSNTIFAILRQSLLLPILYAVVAWPFYRLGKKSKIWIRELKQKGSRIRLKDAAKIMVSDFGMAIFNEISTDRRWVYAISYMLTGFGLFLLYPPMTFSPTIKITVWFLTAGSLVVISLVIYAEVLEKSGAKGELRIAHDMQMGLMPKESPDVRGFDISAACVPASEVGGDFYDYVWMDKKKTRLGVALADVSGKAMKAAMTAVMTSGLMFSEARKSRSPGEILSGVNNPLYLRSSRNEFTALSFAAINTKAKTLKYSSAGQSRPILVRNGAVMYIKTNGVRLPLGVKEGMRYSDIDVKLRRKDTIVFYTDGVPESMNTESKLYGFERFEELLKQNHELTATGLCDKILQDVKAFTKNAEQHDDMTVVVVKVV